MSIHVRILIEHDITASGKFSIALVAKAPIVNAVGATADASGGFEWWDSSHAGLHRKGCDPGDQYVFTPLYALKRPVNRFWRLFREKNRPEPKGDDLSVMFGSSICLLSLMSTLRVCQMV